MRVIDLGGGHDEDYDDEIYDRRGGRGRSRCSINAGLRNLITPLGEISNICSLCSIATTFLRYWIATRK